MIAQLTFREMIFLGLALTIGCVFVAVLAITLERSSYKRQYKKWLKETDDSLWPR
jgi:hypothetical protein